MKKKKEKLLFLWNIVSTTPLWDFLKRGIRVDEKIVSHYFKTYPALKQSYDLSSLNQGDYHLLAQVLNAIPEDVKNSNQNMQIFLSQSLERRADSLLKKITFL